MKKYTISITGKLIDGEEVNSGNVFLKQLKSDNGELHTFPQSFKTWNSKAERTVFLFINNAKKLSVDEVMTKYNLTKEEAKAAFDDALEKYPEKFI